MRYLSYTDRDVNTGRNIDKRSGCAKREIGNQRITVAVYVTTAAAGSAELWDHLHAALVFSGRPRPYRWPTRHRFRTLRRSGWRLDCETDANTTAEPPPEGAFIGSTLVEATMVELSPPGADAEKYWEAGTEVNR